MVLEDNFDDNVLAAWWDIAAASTMIPSEAGGQLRCTSSSPGYDCGGVVTKNKYDLDKHWVKITIAEFDTHAFMSMYVSSKKISGTDIQTNFWELLDEYYGVYKDRETGRFCVLRKLKGGGMEWQYAAAYTAPTGTMKIELKADGKIYFYEDGIERYSEPFALSTKEFYIYLFASAHSPYTGGYDAFDNFLTNIPTEEGTEADPTAVPTTTPTLPTAEAEPQEPVITTYIDAIRNRALWASRFLMDSDSLEPISRAYPLWTQVKPAGTVLTGQVTVSTAGTRVQISSTSAPILSVTIRTDVGNAGNVFVGGSNVSSTTGYIMGPGETVSLDIDDLTDLYIDAANDDDSVSYIAIAT